jgi:hypothetical protein
LAILPVSPLLKRFGQGYLRVFLIQYIHNVFDFHE